MKIALVVIGVLILVLLIAGGSLIGTKNDLVRMQQDVRGQWSQVDVALQRRADLIPNLVETVKGYAKQEQTVFGAIANARAQMAGAKTPAERIEANNQLSGALGRLLVV